MRVSKSSHYEFNNEMFSAITHAFALGLAVTGTIALGIKGVNSGSQVELFSLIGFGVSLMLLYTASTAFHGFFFSKARHVLQVLDHSGVFILIAGSYLPYCLVAIGGKLGIGLLIAIWALCLGGIAYKLFFLNRFKHLETMIYVVLGWLCLVGMVPLWHHLGPVGFWLLVAGGVAYTGGAMLYLQKGIPYIHVIWHLFVILGSLCMYLSIYFYL